MNLMFAAAAMNFKRVMNLWKRRQIIFLNYIFDMMIKFFALVFLKNLKVTF